MARGATSKKVIRYGSTSVILSILVIAAAILANAIVTALAVRYEWFIDMNPSLLYPITDTCYDYLDTYVMNETPSEKIRIVFCDEKETVLASDTLIYVHNTATELAEHYPDTVEIDYLNIWEHPSIARSYGVTASTSVIVECGEQFRVCQLTDFFVFSADDATTPLAYGGEKRFAVAMKAVVSEDAPRCYVTLNHGETFPDYSILYAATDAGYTVSYLDSLSFDIPEDCELLITFNPAQDFTVLDGVSGVSELDKLDAYLAGGGKFMVFVSADTFAAGSFDNLEGYLADWGVTFDHRTGAEGVEECFSIRDTEHSLTVDGYTILGKIPEHGAGADIMADIDGAIRLGNATGISVAEDYTLTDSGDYTSGDRTLTTLLTSHPGSEAWAGGRAVDRTEDGYNLVTLTRRSTDNASVLVCSSIDFAAEEALQSSVYDNEPFFLSAVGAMGKTDTPVHLDTQPFYDDTIRTLTTAQARNITLVLTIVPAALVLVTGVIILIRRKFA